MQVNFTCRAQGLSQNSTTQKSMLASNFYPNHIKLLSIGNRYSDPEIQGNFQCRKED